MNFNQIALELARERQEQLIAEARARSAPARQRSRPSIRRSSAAASSRSASGSPRSHRSSWLGPARGRASSPNQEILS